MSNPLRGCFGKVRHASAQAAWKAIGVMMDRGRSPKRGCYLHAYRCGHCGGWHVGNQPLRSVVS